jgi:hypothetical protein
MNRSTQTLSGGRVITEPQTTTRHTVDSARQYGTAVFFVATLAIGVITVFGESIQSLLHGL